MSLPVVLLEAEGQSLSKKILSVVDYYLPGFMGGGPTRSVAALVSELPEGFEFWILTRDRDLNAARPYPDLRANTWAPCGRAQVMYLSGLGANVFKFINVARRVRPDIVYLNSLFSRLGIRYLVLRRLGLVPPAALVVAPRGELSPGALSLNPLRKRLFLHLAGWTGLLRRTTWHASTDLEKRQIQAALARTARVLVSQNLAVAPDLVVSVDRVKDSHKVPKEVGAARFVFVSRISPMKNLLQAIRLLGQVRGAVSFEVFGPVEDAAYWESCLGSVRKLPENITFTYCGPIVHDSVWSVFAERDFFVLPTRGENFGHVIYEALSAGCPVVLSDTTPWGQIESAGAGWVIPLADEDRWVAALQSCVEMGPDQRESMGQRARAMAMAFVDRESAIQQSVQLFENALAGFHGR